MFKPQYFGADDAMCGKPLVASAWRARCENCEHEWNYIVRDAGDGITQCPKCGSPDHLDGGYRIRYLTGSVGQMFNDTMNGPNDEIPPCNFELKNDGKTITMRILCKECGQRELKERKCFNSLLRAFANQVNIDNIVLSNHIKTQFFGEALKVLKKITAFSYEMKQLSLHTPLTSAGRIPKLCPSCQFHPHKMYNEFNEQFLRDINLFHQAFQDKTTQIYDLAPSNTVCNECRITTLENFKCIKNQIENLLGDVIKEGFTVII